MKKILLLMMAVALGGCVGVEPWTPEELIEFEKDLADAASDRLYQAAKAGEITEQEWDLIHKSNLAYFKRRLDLIVVGRHPLQKRSSYQPLAQERDLSWSQERDLEQAARNAKSDAYHQERLEKNRREFERMIERNGREARRRDEVRRNIPHFRPNSPGFSPPLKPLPTFP